MTIFDLRDIDKEDFEDFLIQVEESFNIKFISNELNDISNFGEFCDHISNKILLENKNDCTTQQSFYKLREIISKTLEIDKKQITPNSILSELFPKEIRRSRIKFIENKLGLKLNVLGPKRWIKNMLLISIFISIIGLFMFLKISILVLFISIIGMLIINKFGIEFKVQKLGEVAQKMTRENYINSRRNNNTVNKNEIYEILKEWISLEFDVDLNKINRETKFI